MFSILEATVFYVCHCKHWLFDEIVLCRLVPLSKFIMVRTDDLIFPYQIIICNFIWRNTG
jgi:hypothetical protein